ncbi:MAG: ABC transporter permease [Verrucomicrobiota bacterium]|jgi:ABC-type transport system involved in multi-copper enzyme maturation permease subunit
MNQFVPLLRNEVVKAVRRKLPYFGIFAVGLLCVIIYFIAGQLSNTATANAWGYVSFSMQLVFTDLGPIFIIVFAAMLLAEETGAGTIRAALAAPVHRWELYLAKAVIGLFYMVVLSIAALLFSAALAKIHYHFGAVGDSAGVVYSRNQVMQQFLLAYALSWIPLAALVMYGILISTIVRTPGAAVAVGISTLFVIEFTKHLAGLDPYIFTRYITYSWLNLLQIAQGMDYQWRPEVWKMIELCGVSAIVTFVVGLILFVRQDLNH